MAASIAKPVVVAPGHPQDSPPAVVGDTPPQAAMTPSMAASIAKPVVVAPGHPQDSPPAVNGVTTVTLSSQGVLNKGPLLGTDTLIGIERIIGSTLLGDTVDLSGAIAPATSTTANLSTGLVTVNGPSGVLLINGTPLSFTVSQFENVTGSNLADTITGNSSDNILLGANGNDILNGGAGNDTLNGGADIDTASYLDAIAAVNVSLTNGNASGGAGFDTLISIENIIGSGFADTITGSSSSNSLRGVAGNDTFIGSAGNDTLDGGIGTVDAANYGQIGTPPQPVMTPSMASTLITPLINLSDIIARASSSLFSPTTCTRRSTSLVVRLTKDDKYLLNNLMSDHSETMGNIFEKSLMLYRAIVEAGEQGGKLLMLTSDSRTGTMTSDLISVNVRSRHKKGWKNLNEFKELDQVATVARSIDQEIILAVRDQFADKDKTPISLNRAYIKATKGLKSERIAIRASTAFMERLADTEKRTGLNKSNLFRDSLHLFNFVKREFDKGGVSFYIGDIQVEGI